MIDAVSVPWNWCDRRCERCPLAGECKLYARELEAAARIRATGLGESATGALSMIAESLDELDVDAYEAACVPLDDDFVVDNPLATEDGRAFADAGAAYASAALALIELHPKKAIGTEPWVTVVLVGAKTGALIDDLPWSDDDQCRDYFGLSILLIDKLLNDSRTMLEIVRARDDSLARNFDRAHGRLRAEIDRHLDRVGAEERRALEELMRSGRAPSPFCVVGKGGNSRSE